MSLEATFYIQIEKNNACRENIERLTKHYSYQEAKKLVAAQRHCDGSIAEKPVAYTDNYIFKTCPCRFYNNDLSTLIELVNQRKQGVLPFNKGYLEQPVLILEAMDYTERLINKYQEEERKKQDNKSRRKK